MHGGCVQDCDNCAELPLFAEELARLIAARTSQDFTEWGGEQMAEARRRYILTVMPELEQHEGWLRTASQPGNF